MEELTPNYIQGSRETPEAEAPPQLSNLLKELRAAILAEDNEVNERPAGFQDSKTILEKVLTLLDSESLPLEKPILREFKTERVTEDITPENWKEEVTIEVSNRGVIIIRKKENNKNKISLEAKLKDWPHEPFSEFNIDLDLNEAETSGIQKVKKGEELGEELTKKANTSPNQVQAITTKLNKALEQSNLQFSDLEELSIVYLFNFKISNEEKPEKELAPGEIIVFLNDPKLELPVTLHDLPTDSSIAQEAASATKAALKELARIKSSSK
jgi:hypothetical protein